MDQLLFFRAFYGKTLIFLPRVRSITCSKLMSINQLIRIPLFMFLFCIGASALSLAILQGDLLEYYHNRFQVKSAQKQIKDLQALNADYEALVQRLTDNPSLVRRLAPVPRKSSNQDANEVEPVVRAEQLLAAQKALARSQPAPQVMVLPPWLERCLPPRRHMALFLAGGALILISFIFFGLVKPVANEDPPHATGDPE